MAAIASRFNAAAASNGDRGGLSDKVSSLANRFGPTIHDEQPSKYPPSPSLRRPLTSSTRARTPSVRRPFLNHVGRDSSSTNKSGKGIGGSEAIVTQQSAGSVNNVAKIFDTHSTVNPLNKDSSANTNGSERTSFINAKNLFRNAEENQDKQFESKVSSYAKLIDSNEAIARNPGEIPEDNAIADVAKNFDVNNNKDASTTKSKDAMQATDKGKVKLDGISGFGEDSLNRFSSAAKLFESGLSSSSLSDDIPTTPNVSNDDKDLPTQTVNSDVDAVPAKTVANNVPTTDTTKIESETDSKPPPTIENEPNVEQMIEEKKVLSVRSSFADAARVFGGV